MIFDNKWLKLFLLLQAKKELFDKWLVSPSGRAVAYILAAVLIIIVFKMFLISMQ